MIEPVRNVTHKEGLEYFIRGNPYESFDRPAKGIRLLNHDKEKRQYLFFNDANENYPTVYIIEEYRRNSKDNNRWLFAKIRQVSKTQSRRIRKRIEDLLPQCSSVNFLK